MFMTGRTHMLGGAATCLGLLAVGKTVLPVPENIIDMSVFTLAGAVAALLPDIDEPRSTIARKMPVTSSLFGANRFFKGLRLLNPFLSKTQRYDARKDYRDASHRGITHYLLTWFVVGVLAVLLSLFAVRNTYGQDMLLGIIPGYLSHILLDLVSGKIPMLRPLYHRSIGVCLIRTDSITEKLLLRPVLILTIGLLILFLYR